MKLIRHVIGLLFLLSASGYLLFHSYHEVKQKTIADFNKIQLIYAKQAAKGIQDFFAHYAELLKQLVDTGHIIDNDETGKELLQLFYKNHSRNLAEVRRIDANGKIIDAYPQNFKIIGMDRSNQEHINRLLKNRQLVISDVYATSTGAKAIAIAEPIMKNNKFIGGLILVFAFEKIAKRYLEDIKIGEDGYAWMMTQKGIELYCPVPGHVGNSVFENCKDFPTIISMAREMTRGEQGATIYVYDRIRDETVKSIKKHAVYFPINLGNTFWSIVVAAPENEILATMEGFKNSWIIFISLLISLAVVWSFYSVRNIIRFQEESKRKSIEEKLRKALEKYSLLYDVMTEGVCLHKVIYNDSGLPVDYKILDINPAYTRITGLAKEQVINKPASEVYGTGEAPYLDIYEQVAQSGHSITFETFFSPMNQYFVISVNSLANGEFATIFFDITDRKKVELALQESEARFRRLAENAPDVIYRIVLPEGIFEYVSPASTRILGFTPEEFYQSPSLVSRIMHPDWQDKFAKQWEKLLAGEVPPTYEYRIITKSGEDKWLNQRNLLIRNENGQPLAIEGIITDITERKRAEEALEKRLIALSRPLDDPTVIAFNDLFNLEDIQQIQDLFAQATGVASIITNPDGSPITKPSNFCRLCIDIIRQTELGLKNCYYSDAIIGRHHPDGPIVQQCLSGGLWDAGASITVGGRHIANWLIGQVRNEAQGEGNMRDYARRIGVNEAEFIKAFYEVTTMPENQFRQVADALFALANQLSTVAYQNVQQARFITERKRAEEKYRNLFENAVVGMFQTTPEGRFISANPMLAKIFGYESADDLVKTVTDIGEEGYVDCQQRVEFIKRLNGSGETQSLTTRFYKKNKEIIWALIEAKAFKNSQGEVLYYQGSLVDVTDKKKLEETKQKLEDQLRQAQKMEAIGTLAGGIAHDFNNILMAILGYTEMTLLRYPGDDQGKQYLEQVRKASYRAKELVDQILTFSRQHEGERKPLAISLIIKEALKLLRASLPATIEIKQNINSEGKVMGDPTQMHQIIMNLSTNAFHAMPEGGTLAVSLEDVEISAPVIIDLPPGLYVKVQVKDTGKGIEPIIRERIFEPFFTTKEVGKGSGMGLAVVMGIVKSHGGAITLETEVGRGSTFNIYIPRTTTETSPPSEEQPADFEYATGRILFVDDEGAIADFVKAALEMMGYEVMISTDSVAAREIFKAQPDRFDLVITDLTMPKLTGLDLARQLSLIRPEIPIILCTGYKDKFSKAEVTNLGIIDIITKPIGIKELGTAVQKAITVNNGYKL